MATKSLGLTGRDFSTLAAYASYVNALALSAPEVLEVYNDSGPVADTTNVTLSGWSGGSSTNTVTIRPATGQGFKSHASASTNALAYNATFGAALTNNVSTGTCYAIGSFVIIDGLQFQKSNAAGGNLMSMGTGSAIRNTILKHNGPSGSYAINSGGGFTAENTIFHVVGGGGAVQFNHSDIIITNCLAVATTATGATAFRMQYGLSPAPLVRNTAVIGFITDFQNTGHASCSNNATDKSSFGGTNYGATAGQTSLTSADFVSLTAGSENFRIVSGSTKLKDLGATTGPTTDIFGTAKPQGAAYDIGPVEYTAAGGAVTLTGANSTLGLTAGTGAISVTPPAAGTVNLAGSNTTFGLTAGTGTASITPAAGTVTSDEFRNYSNILQTAVTVPYVTFLSMSGSLVLALTNQTTNGAGKLVISNAALVAGTSYMMATWDTADSNADTMKRGFKKVTAA